MQEKKNTNRALEEKKSPGYEKTMESKIGL